MFFGDSKIREQLRDLPTGYLLDLLADSDDVNDIDIRAILHERGMDEAEIRQGVRRRTDSRMPRGHVLWTATRFFSIFCAVLVTLFNLITYYQLLHGTSPLKGVLVALSAGGSLFGFFLGYKLTTHVYQGAPHELYCGFPVPVGFVDLKTGQERFKPKTQLLLSMVFNAAVGLTLVLFPLLLIHHLLD
jgi:hypothetical protein